MDNSDYTFQDVVNGNGYFSVEGNTGYSSGVATLQTYLNQIGYDLDVDGLFGEATKEAVMGFQYQLGITQDGAAGPMTCLRLNTVHNSKYFTEYGRPLSKSEWTRANILAGKFNNVDLLARIILAEGGYDNLSQETGVAIVIKNRCDNSSSQYWESPTEYPNASIYARVIGKPNQYQTAENNSTAEVPRRGMYGNNENGFIDPAWKKAVDLAEDITVDKVLSVTAYKVNGTSVSAQTVTITSANNKQYLNQTDWYLYVANYNTNDIDISVQPLTFSSKSGSDVIYKM